jgi:zinc/manganese transport system substrate-binding protein
VGRNGDAHVYQPTPAAAKAVGEADILFTNGLEFGGWLERLSEAAAFDGTLAVTTKGIEPIPYDAHVEHDDDEDHAGHEEHGDHGGHDDHAGHDHGAYDPHAWLSPTLAITYADNITAALAQARPADASVFYENRAGYVSDLKTLDADIRAMMEALPDDRRTIVTSHDAFQYFARDYGLRFLAPQGLSTDSEASAKDVAKLIEQMRAENVSAVFLENIADSRLLKQIADETGAQVGGTLYPGALSDTDGPAATYLELMRHNATTLADSLSG